MFSAGKGTKQVEGAVSYSKLDPLHLGSKSVEKVRSTNSLCKAVNFKYDKSLLRYAVKPGEKLFSDALPDHKVKMLAQ